MNFLKFIKNFKNYFLLLFLTATLINPSYNHDHMTEHEIEEEINSSIITYGSALRIENQMTKFHLYSNKLTWGTGSQMQIITGIKSKDEANGLWVIKEGHDKNAKETGSPVMCNDIIRLEHSSTGKNLHSHNYKSWITDSQEACGYGNNGIGDINDEFKIICYNSSSDKVTGKTNFFLYHEATNKYLYINIKNSLFDERNCRNCPIIYQREVSLTDHKDKQCIWNIKGGLIFKDNSILDNNANY